MKNLKSAIPNLITSLNLLCGCLGIIAVINLEHTQAVYLMLFALLFDFCDGFVARVLKVQSEMGKELDSLADMVTFGVLPGVMMFYFFKKISCAPGVCTGLLSSDYLPYMAFLIPVASAWRLAKFNVDTRQSDRFYGIPTPANAAFFATIPYLLESGFLGTSVLSEPRFVLFLVMAMSYLMVADVPMIALKFSGFAIRGNEFRYLLIIIAGTILSLFHVSGIPLIILTYIGLSIIENIVSLKKDSSNINV